MSNSTKYNGWTNWETWLVGMYYVDSWRDEGEQVEADQLREYVEEVEQSQSDVGGLMLDAFNGIMSQVNWTELAEHVNEDL
jgi:triacylglycerol esterase/lipase EstA (alpha/beta hydrolase family)